MIQKGNGKREFECSRGKWEKSLHLNYKTNKIKCYLGTVGYKLNEFKKWNKWLIFTLANPNQAG